MCKQRPSWRTKFPHAFQWVIFSVMCLLLNSVSDLIENTLKTTIKVTLKCLYVS